MRFGSAQFYSIWQPKMKSMAARLDKTPGSLDIHKSHGATQASPITEAGEQVNHEFNGIFLLSLALIFNALRLLPEARIERIPVNDLVFHVEAARKLGKSILHGEPFLDPWVSQWSLGFPLWRIYQPLPHLFAAAVMELGRSFVSPQVSFAAFYYVLLAFLPASIYLGSRLIGLNPVGAGLASILILAPSEGGDFGRYGVSYGAYVWRGSGLYTEL